MQAQRQFRPRMAGMGQGGGGAMFEDFYVYQASFLPLTASGTGTDNINIQADSDFVVQKMTYVATISNAIQTDSSRVLPLVTIQVTDSGSGRDMFAEAVPVTAIMGDGNLPFILPKPKLYASRSSIIVNVSNLTSTAYNLYIAFIGYKVFRKGM